MDEQTADEIVTRLRNCGDNSGYVIQDGHVLVFWPPDKYAPTDLSVEELKEAEKSGLIERRIQNGGNFRGTFQRELYTLRHDQS